MDLGEFNAIFVLRENITLICLDEVTVVDLTQLFIVQVLNKEVEHFCILLVEWFHLLFLLDILLNRNHLVIEVHFLVLFGDEFLVPTDEEIVAVKIRPADLGSHWKISLFRENDTVDELTVDVL